MYPPQALRSVLPPDLQIGGGFWSVFSDKIPHLKPSKLKYLNTSVVEPLPKKYIAFFLQVPVDAQLIEHSPHYCCFYTMLKDIFDVLPQGYQLLVREHPQYQGKYDERIYQLIDDSNEISVANSIDLTELIIGAEVCVVNNSAVGIESLLLGTKVVTLGNSYYSNKGVTFDFEKKLGIGKLLSKAINQEFNTIKVDSFLFEFIFEYLVEGHFQNKELTFKRKLTDYFDFN